MSSFRNRQRRDDWLETQLKERQQKAAADAITKKMEPTEQNFPTLGTAHPVATMRVPPAGFVTLAKKWACDDEIDRKITEMRRTQVETEERVSSSMFTQQPRKPRKARKVQEEYYEEDTEPAPPASAPAAGLDETGWTTVERKVRAPRRELTIGELDARARQQDNEDQADFELNGQLFESNRHDHDRV